jgi:hypothetical protein
LLWEDGTTKFLFTRNEGIDGTTRGCTHQSSQNTASIHRLGRSSHRGRTITAIYTSLSSNASDYLPPNHHFTRLVISAEYTRFHHGGPQLTASLHEKFWIPRIRNLMKAINMSA